MLPFYTLVIGADDNIGRVSVLDPIHDAQHDAVIRRVDPVGAPSNDGTLTDLPRTGTPETVSHAGYHEQPIE